MRDLHDIYCHFALGPGELLAVAPVGVGLINDTFVVTVAAPAPAESPSRFVVQRINRDIFPDADQLMGNMRRVIDHLGHSLSDARRRLLIVPTRLGEDFYRDAAGDCWRVFPFIEGTMSHSVVASPKQAWQAGFAFGEFSRALADLPDPPLHDVLPDFHDTAQRYANFLAAVELDPVGRAADAKVEIDAATATADWATLITDAQSAGEIPLRVAHNDSKIENVLFDSESGAVVCVVDLDTTMPGSILHDFGDLVRTATVLAPEDEVDLERIGVSLEIFESLAEGFLAGCGTVLTRGELDLLPAAGKVIVYEQALRFLTDYLLGDSYYRVSHASQNLERARNQLRVAQILHGMQPSLERVIDALEAKMGG